MKSASSKIIHQESLGSCGVSLPKMVVSQFERSAAILPALCDWQAALRFKLDIAPEIDGKGALPNLQIDQGQIFPAISEGKPS